MKKSNRYFKHDFEVRYDGDQAVIRGYVAKFDSVSEDLGGFKEVLAPKAFSPALRKSDTYAFWNHNSDIVLGRKGNKTLQIKQDDTGLFIKAYPARSMNQYVEMIARGDVPYASFGFIAGEDVWDHKKNIRTVTRVDELPEVSVGVPFPAYKETDIEAALRSKAKSMGITIEGQIDFLGAFADRLNEIIGKKEAKLLKTSLESTHSRSDQARIGHTHSRLAAYQLRQLIRRMKQQLGG